MVVITTKKPEEEVFEALNNYKVKKYIGRELWGLRSSLSNWGE